tara:strand:- start:2388 stop:3332 length:945 start_codon:yes stop_codon:yes gene_type:complete
MKQLMVKCAVCGKEFESDRKLHAHLKAHKLRMVEYYQKYFPRYDKHDNKIIKFKNKKQYFSTDFNSRENLRNWLKSSDEETVKNYCEDLLTKRKEEKSLVYSPTQVELRTLLFPPIQFYHKRFGNYYKLCESIGYQNRFENVTKIPEPEEYDKNEYKIFIDTREQTPLKFDRDFRVRKLKFGDYTFSDRSVSCNSYIERKSLNDFIGTISGGFDRFQREIERAESEDAYLIIVVEKKLSSALNFNSLRELSSKIKATPEFIFHRVRQLIQNNNHIQFLFVDGQDEASRVTEKILTVGCIVRGVDLQLCYDTKNL